MTPAGTSNELDVQNGWEENTKHTHMHAGTPNKTKTKDLMSLSWIQLNFVTLGLESDGCQHYYIAILLAIKKVITTVTVTVIIIVTVTD